ncbi:MAG: ParB N-terminal domain-containing protein [Firmicutes bacterium]|nr:ParB N-terminal domain-containing protein [Bacillota bacterium]
MLFFRKRKGVKSLEQERAKYGTLNYRNMGVTAIEIDKIVGSVDRYKDFDQNFEWIHRRPDARSRAIEQAMARGEILPPIEVFELDNKYFVVDGHHRVRAAKRIGQEFLDANVTKLIPTSGKYETA